MMVVFSPYHFFATKPYMHETRIPHFPCPGISSITKTYLWLCAYQFAVFQTEISHSLGTMRRFHNKLLYQKGKFLARLPEKDVFQDLLLIPLIETVLTFKTFICHMNPLFQRPQKYQSWDWWVVSHPGIDLAPISLSSRIDLYQTSLETRSPRIFKFDINQKWRTIQNGWAQTPLTPTIMAKGTGTMGWQSPAISGWPHLL